jgi:hypothetical protein
MLPLLLPPMRRSIAVAIAAVIALLGSLVVVAGGIGLAVWVMRNSSPDQASGMPLRSMLLGFSAITIAFGVWGALTAISLFRRRPWARISVLMFAAFLAIFCASGLVGTAVVQLPLAPVVAAKVRLVILGLYGVLAALAVWWLILFTRPRVKAEFTLRQPPASSELPPG